MVPFRVCVYLVRWVAFAFSLRFRGITHYLLVEWWGHSSVLGTADNTAFAFLLQQTERVLPIAQMEHASWRGTCFMEHVSWRGACFMECASWRGTCFLECASWRGTCFMEHASWRRSLTLDLEHEQKCDWCQDATVGTSGADMREVRASAQVPGGSSSWPHPEGACPGALLMSLRGRLRPASAWPWLTGEDDGLYVMGSQKAWSDSENEDGRTPGVCYEE